MKTDALIDLLVTGSSPVRPYAVTRRFLTALVIGAGGALVLLWLVFGFNPTLRENLSLPNFWLKSAFTLTLTAAGLIASQRLARPGRSVGGVKWAAIAPVLAMWMIAAFVLTVAEPTARAHLILGDTWNRCPLNIALLSLPPFCAAVWAMRGLAPTRPRVTGAAIGIFSGALGASAYGLFCGELAPPFLAIWYVVGMLVPTAIGFTIGPRLLRW